MTRTQSVHDLYNTGNVRVMKSQIEKKFIEPYVWV